MGGVWLGVRYFGREFQEEVVGRVVFQLDVKYLGGGCPEKVVGRAVWLQVAFLGGLQEEEEGGEREGRGGYLGGLARFGYGCGCN